MKLRVELYITFKKYFGYSKKSSGRSKPIFCAVSGFWSMKSQIPGIFIGIEMTRLIFGRLELFFKSYIQFHS